MHLYGKMTAWVKGESNVFGLKSVRKLTEKCGIDYKES